MNESQSVATNSHLPTAAYSPGSWWPPHRFCSLSLHILYFSSYSGLIEGSQIRTDLKQPPVPSYTIPVNQYLHRKDALSVALLEDKPSFGAGDGNRTRMVSTEGF